MIANANPVSASPVQGLDVPIIKLIPRQERKTTAKHRERIEASLRAVGLLEPLVVYPVDGGYEILDGNLRYRILLDLGVETVPCLISREREAYTANRMVNQLSASQEMRMIRKSLEELDEKTIAGALGINRIEHRLNKGLIKKLDPLVAEAFEASKLTVQCAKELALVKADRQREILKMMEQYKDYGITFARGLVLKTTSGKRAASPSGKTPWDRAAVRKNNLLTNLREAEQQQEFYAGLYRQYSTNLLKLVIYARAILNRPKLREYLAKTHPGQLETLEPIVLNME